MKQIIVGLLLLFCFSARNVNGQVVSLFNWNSGSVSAAVSGPNASSVSSSATISTGGKSGSNGLNPGLPKADLNLTITGSSTFDVDGLDISFDYQREESAANFITRGSSLVFGLSGGNLFCNYRVSNGAGSYTTISSGSVYAIPNDDTYRTYRFIYTPATGDGEILVDGVSVWTNNGTNNRNMYWTSAGNIVIGELMDGSGSNKTCLDNMSFTKINAPLPISLISFEATLINNIVKLNWTTASENNNDYFTIERSKNSTDWVEINKVKGAGKSDQVLYYSLLDTINDKSNRYYRLKQTDFNGKFTYSEIRSINLQKEKTDDMLFPNPTRANLMIRKNDGLEEEGRFTVLNSLFQEEKVQISNTDAYYIIETTLLKEGIYYLIINSQSEKRSIPFLKL